jgi:predicted AlkP superfamily pyrophosphatase or phosphodiesterase
MKAFQGVQMFSKLTNVILALFVVSALAASCQSKSDDQLQQPAPAPVLPAGEKCEVPKVPATEKNPDPALRTNLKKFQAAPIVLMISIDGFRNDYLEKYQPPTLLAWASEGVRAEGIIPSFPTLTFPNHISLVTGRRPGHHGIVGNTFYDETRKEKYSIGDNKTVNDGSWYRGEPIWATAERNGTLSATCFWVGSEAKISGVHPTYLKPYDGEITNKQRVDWVVEWLQLPEERRPHLITLYFSEVDDMGHKYGPDAEETKKGVLNIDAELARLKTFIDGSGLPVQVMVMSDHGMRKIEKTADLSGAENLMKMLSSGKGALTYFYSEDAEQIEKAYQEVKAIQAAQSGLFKVYKADELPANWDLDDVSRRGDLIVVGEPGVYIGFKKPGDTGNVGSSNKGTHGWDVQQDPLMQGLFIASGSMFKKDLRIPAFDNVHVYPLVLEMLKLKTTESYDGKLEVLKPVLK